MKNNYTNNPLRLFQKAFGKISNYFTEVESIKATKKNGIAATSVVHENIYIHPKESKSNIKKMEKSNIYSIINQETIIDGSISSSSNIIVEGVINGDLSSEGTLKIFGQVTGNVSAETALIKNATIKGDITIKESVEIGTLSKIDGNINARNANIDCAIAGNIDVAEKLVIGNSAVTFGDISTSSLTVYENAIIGGKVKVLR